MKSLNCSSQETIYQSLSDIFSISLEELFIFIDNCKKEDPSCSDREPPLHSDQLFINLQADKSISLDYEKTHWFHATRVSKDENFSDGLLPNHIAADKYWAFLYSLVENEISYNEWQNFKDFILSSQDDKNARLYQLKTKNIDQTGPFAFLFKDTAFAQPHSGIHSYLTIPESIEDICLCFEERLNIEIREKFKNSTLPCIVEFYDYSTEVNYLRDALYYIYCINFDFDCLNYFAIASNSKGNIIPHDQIISISCYSDEDIRSPNNPRCT